MTVLFRFLVMLKEFTPRQCPDSFKIDKVGDPLMSRVGTDANGTATHRATPVPIRFGSTNRRD